MALLLSLTLLLCMQVEALPGFKKLVKQQVGLVQRIETISQDCLNPLW
jgi:hypothetical protein